jgi:hypothetical protein
MERKPMIAYCFLTYHHIQSIYIWEKYFEKKENFCVFIHPKMMIQSYHYSFPVTILEDTIHTKNKTDISIVRATLHLIKQAYEKRSEITHFVFLTQNCIPLYSFDQHYKMISNLQKSCISVISGNKIERFQQLSIFLKHRIQHPNRFLKQQPNMILTRNDVKWLIENDYTNDFQNMLCPDEHYFINLFLYVYQKEFIRQQTHFCNPHLQRTQAIYYPHISNEMISKIRKMGFLFMRKVDDKTKMDISYMLHK